MRFVFAMIALAACGAPCRDAGTICTMVGDTEGRAGFNGADLKAADTRIYFPTDVTPEPGSERVVFVDWNNEIIRRIGDDGRVNTIVGMEQPGDGADDKSDRTDAGSPGTKVRLNHPLRAIFGPDGDLYLANWHNHKIRRWDPAGDRVRIIAGTTEDGNGANAGFGGDGGPAVDAILWFPSAITFDDDGTLYFVDEKNERVRRIKSDGIIDTVAGNGTYDHVDGPCLEAEFRFPEDPGTPQPRPGGGLVGDGDGILYASDTYNHVIRRIDTRNDVVETIAGIGSAGYSGDGGPATEAAFSSPTDLAWGPDGRLYVADTYNNAIRAIDLVSGVVETVAGTGELGMGDDEVPAAESALHYPYGIGFADDGALWIADTYNSKIRRVTP
jgi:streptogramin lyase